MAKTEDSIPFADLEIRTVQNFLNNIPACKESR